MGARPRPCYLSVGAILVVSKKDNPGYLVNYFKPTIKKTFFEKIFLMPGPTNKDANVVFDAEGVVRIYLD